MASSIREKGVIQPIIVRLISCIEDEARRKEAGNAKYELVVGERRWRGSKIAGKTEIPSVIRKLDDHEALMLQVIENAQREDPDPLEEAEQYDALLKSGKSTVDELAAEIGKSHDLRTHQAPQSARPGEGGPSRREDHAAGRAPDRPHPQPQSGRGSRCADS
jgi:ParB/RepB/Spo0J family partition protein